MSGQFFFFAFALGTITSNIILGDAVGSLFRVDRPHLSASTLKYNSGLREPVSVISVDLREPSKVCRTNEPLQESLGCCVVGTL
jgi:hypothetical protein